MERTLKCNTFYGHEISNYGKENGYVDYGTLSKSFDAVLNNTIWSVGWDMGYGWEKVHGADYIAEAEEIRDKIQELEEEKDDTEDEARIEEIEEEIEELEEELLEKEREEYEPEVFQWYIIDNNGVDILEYWTDELVYYNDALDIYLWGVTHYGTSWSYVLTDIKIEEEEE